MNAVENIAEKVNNANNRLYGATGTTRLTETWVQWGLHPDSTEQEIDLMVRDFEEYMKDKSTGLI